jgi:hypothetical protein
VTDYIEKNIGTLADNGIQTPSTLQHPKQESALSSQPATDNANVGSGQSITASTTTSTRGISKQTKDPGSTYTPRYSPKFEWSWETITGLKAQDSRSQFLWRYIEQSIIDNAGTRPFVFNQQELEVLFKNVETHQTENQDNTAPATGTQSPTLQSDSEMDQESHGLLLTLAWMLDIFMEIHVHDWQTVMADTGRDRGHDWFRVDKLNITEVGRRMQPEGGSIPVSKRLLHNHITAANQVISDRWEVNKPLKPGELKYAYLTLAGLLQATVAAWVSKGNALDFKLESPQQTARFFITKFPNPLHLSPHQLKHYLTECQG